MEASAATDACTVFQQIDIEEYTAPGAPPSIRIYGVTEEGYSVLVHVRGFLPYLYVHAPRGFRQDTCAAFRNKLNVRCWPQCELCNVTDD